MSAWTCIAQFWKELENFEDILKFWWESEDSDRILKISEISRDSERYSNLPIAFGFTGELYDGK